jgi:hypothetical protein
MEDAMMYKVNVQIPHASVLIEAHLFALGWAIENISQMDMVSEKILKKALNWPKGSNSDARFKTLIWSNPLFQALLSMAGFRPGRLAGTFEKQAQPDATAAWILPALDAICTAAADEALSRKLRDQSEI